MTNVNRQAGTRPLAAVVPDCDALLANPAGYLKERELRIGGRRVPWWHFLLPPALLLFGICFPTRLGFALAIAAPVHLGVLIYWAWPVDRELVLRADGIRFRLRNTAVWCPWSLFSSPGQAFVRRAGWFDTEITLPILYESVRLVVYERDGRVIHKGHHVLSEQFAFLSDHEACVPSVYAMRPQDLGDLLLHLGRALGGPDSVPADCFPAREMPATAVTATDPRAVAGPAAARVLGQAAVPPQTDGIDIRSFPEADPNGWITIPVTRLAFANRCCDCCGPAIDRYSIRIDEGRRFLRLVPLYGRFNPEKGIEVAVPFCPSCRREDVAWGIALTALALVVAFAPLGFLVLIGFAGLSPGIGLLLFVVSLFIAPFAALLERKPFQARYNDSERTVSLRFREEVLAEEMLS